MNWHSGTAQLELGLYKLDKTKANQNRFKVVTHDYLVFYIRLL